ncbi:hypothetical protein FVE85_7669 [Porphyridium purpureum]|uniref:HEAT repeat domain-containing protein n=1 Tax=Porphyridium purpureum TaxID=35688 RepID=A0A5J4ZAR7_PORPP|nr:hypothetical protein FVE85_7669 [Porphyridium purpureum]|eukprot:POR0689..scf295_1
MGGGCGPARRGLLRASAPGRSRRRGRARARAQAAVRRRVVLAMEADETPAPPSKESVMEMIRSENGGLRARAVNQARFLDPQECLDVLFVGAEDKNPQIRYAAVAQLATACTADPERTFELVKRIVLTDKEPTVQAAAADVLTGLSLPGSFELLEEIYSQTGDWMLKFSIISGLGEMGDPRGYELLLRVLETASDDEPLLKVGALGSLGELGDRRALPMVEKYIDHPDSAISERAKVARDNLNAIPE